MPRFVARQRKQRDKSRADSGDTNQVEIIGTHAQRSNASQHQSDIASKGQYVASGKKKKRLEKYIDKKLRKEEGLDLMKRLASSKIDTSKLRASSNLGKRKPSNQAATKSPLEHSQIVEDSETDTELSDGDDDSVEEEEEVSDVGMGTDAGPAKFVLGSGLKRALEGADPPQIPARKRRRGSKAQFQLPTIASDLWEGFTSSEGGNASSDSQLGSGGDEGSGLSDEDETDSDDAPDETSSESDSGSETREARKARSSAFKAWATAQTNDAAGYVPQSVPTSTHMKAPESSKIYAKSRPPDSEPLVVEFTSDIDRKSHSIQVERSEDIQQARAELPVVAEEQKIMESVFNNPVTIIEGATGSGKTTQVPQFLLEAGFGSKSGPNPGMIGVTQPRRVAAISMSRRVAHELGSLGNAVGYQVRFDTSVSPSTKVKFMTDGILIREVGHDFLLSKYSVVVIDEAHERSTNTDILIGMISRIVSLRENMSKEDSSVKPLKLVIMSATLKMTDFLENPALFRQGRPPVVQAEGRQYPVTKHFSRKTQLDFVSEAFEKICKGHKRLPPGGMLVFLTGQNEIEDLGRRLTKALSNATFSRGQDRNVRVTAHDAPLEAEDLTALGHEADPSNLDDHSDNIDDFNEDIDEFGIDDHGKSSHNALILPLYSQLPTKDQLRVFEDPPEDTRVIILATNIAETSITIPGIRYVFDSGREKSKVFDQVTGVQSFKVDWISKASADQRAGRAGRTGPGHTYRLYSSAVFERDFTEHQEPEIVRMPVEGVVLQLKSMGLQQIANFPFPSAPDRQSLAKAEQMLTHLGAISRGGLLTDLGRDISRYPISPRFAKILAIGDQHDCLSFSMALVAALATPNIFLQEYHVKSRAGQIDRDSESAGESSEGDDRARQSKARNRAHGTLSIHSRTSDAIKSLTAICAYGHASEKEQFCRDMYLSERAMSEAASLSSQLSSIVRGLKASSSAKSAGLSFKQLPLPTKLQVNAIEQFVAASFLDQIAILASESGTSLGPSRRPTRAIDVPYLPLFPIHDRRSDSDITDVAVYIHPSSVLSRLPVKQLPTYVVFHHLQQSQPSSTAGSEQMKKPKTRMHPLAAVSGRQLTHLAKDTSLLEYGKPIGKVEEVSHGRRRICVVVPSLVSKTASSSGWPLPAVKVEQSKTSTGWEVDRIIG